MNPVKVAGIFCCWSQEYAQSYKNKLCENGFFAKVLCYEGDFYVAYCYRSFSNLECEKAVSELLGGDCKNDL